MRAAPAERTRARGRMRKRAKGRGQLDRDERIVVQPGPSHTVGHGRYLLFEWPAARGATARALTYAVRRGGPATFTATSTRRWTWHLSVVALAASSIAASDPVVPAGWREGRRRRGVARCSRHRESRSRRCGLPGLERHASQRFSVDRRLISPRINERRRGRRVSALSISHSTNPGHLPGSARLPQRRSDSRLARRYQMTPPGGRQPPRSRPRGAGRDGNSVTLQSSPDELDWRPMIIAASPLASAGNDDVPALALGQRICELKGHRTMRQEPSP